MVYTTNTRKADVSALLLGVYSIFVKPEVVGYGVGGLIYWGTRG